MSEIPKLFGARAGAYACFRPEYPDALFHWLANRCPEHQRALDIACGNGQASRPLRQYFTQVLACDASLDQLRASEDFGHITLFAASAEAQPLVSASLDLIVVAQALHWFATPEFFAEVTRLLKPGGLFCAWCYSLLRIDVPLDALIDVFYWGTLGGYWPAGRSSVDAGYSDIYAPFSRIEPPDLAIEMQWNFNQLLGYLRTWSAVQCWERQHDRDPVTELEPDLREAWGDINQLRVVRWPLHFVAGIPH